MNMRRIPLVVCSLIFLSVPSKLYGQSFTCNPPKVNQIVCENSFPGSPESDWDIIGSGDPTIQGFATSISVNQGETVHFKIKTNASAYRLDIFRMGYYQGNGARFITTVMPTASLPQTQPACLTDSSTGLIDCGNWAESASWTVPASATSGIYFAEMTRTDTGGGSQIFFIVRSDSSHSAMLFQTSDTAWQAYNNWGGNSLYTGNTPAGRAYKVSYNRPYQTQDYNNRQTWVLNSEYPMIRFLEANGYDVTYTTGVDTDRSGALIQNHKILLSVGHDEYWSAAQRANVEAARDAGVNLAFFSGNELFWKTRWENSTDSSNTPYRTLVCYKETHANQVIDPKDPPTWTGTWRDPRFSPPADGGRPENALSGNIFYVNGTRADAMTVPASFGNLRFWRNTSVAHLTAGQVATMPAGTLGFEWDQDVDNGFRPAGLIGLSSTTINVNGFFLEDFGNTYGPGIATHSPTLYRASSGALVFAAGTVQWSWGLDGHHTNGSNSPDANMQQATVNVLADMGVQPGTLQSGLVPAVASTDTTPPISTIVSPTAGARFATGAAVTISGTASDGGGGVVAGIEVSVDGGLTWHRATGLNSWTYSWTPTVSGPVTIQSRSVDDSLNLELPSAGVSVTVTGTAPVITNIHATLVTSSGATITWTTDVPSTSQVNYGTTTSYGSSTTVNTSLVTNHAVALTGLTASTVYHIQAVSQGANGSTAVSNDFSFTTSAGSGGGSGTVTIWNPSTTPGTASSSDTSSVELGVKFTSDISGYIVGIRFYKGASNTGTHVGSLWSATGTVLSSATFTGESASGWQEVDFGTPVAISANTVYVASYHAPAGGYAINQGYFANSGFDNPPLHALKDGTNGGNGVYIYGTTSAFPVNSFQSSNYWVDVVFSETANSSAPIVSNVQASAITQSTATITWTTNKASSSQVFYGTTASYGSSSTLDATQVTNHSVTLTGLTASTLYHFKAQSTDIGNNTGSSTDQTFTTTVTRTTPPVISAVQATGVTSSSATITWTTDEPATSQVNYGTTSAYGSSTPIDNNTVTSHSVILTGLTASTLYHYQVLSTDPIGLSSASTDFTFTTSAPATQSLWSSTTVPTTPSQADPQSVELGVKFTSDVSGTISGVRFYKGAANTGTHIGNLWDNTGALLATATFTNETASGWQQVLFNTPVAITAGSVYVASYFAPVGRYSIDLAYFANTAYDNPPLHALKDGASGGNGVFVYGPTSQFPTNAFQSTNYWVDVLFVPGGGSSGSVSLLSIGLNPSSVTGGSTSTGTITLTGAAPAGGSLVTLSSSNTAVATVPAGVTVPAGAATATFAVTTAAVTNTTTVNISSTFAATTKTTAITVSPAAALTSVTVNPTSVVGPASSTGTVTLTGPAPGGGVLVTLSSSNTAAATTPASVTVAAGATTATFIITTNAVAASTSVTISGTYGGITRTTSLTVTAPAALSSLSLNPTLVAGTVPSTGTVTLTAAAPTGGAVVSLSSNNTAAATVPVSVTVPTGSSSATFTVTTKTVAAATSVTISSTYSGVTRTAALTVTVALSSVSLNPTSISAGGSSTGTVTLAGRAPTGGAVVTLSSSNAIATVPASVTVPGAATSATFSVSAPASSPGGSATITASYGGASKTAVLTVGTVTTVTFDDLSNINSPLNGQYPSGLINWGTGAWFLSGPWGQFTTSSISFRSPGITSASFTFLVSRQLKQMDAFNGGTAASLVSISCPGQITKQATLAVGQVATILTGWTAACSTVTISSTNGWDTNFDNLVLQ